MDNENTEDSLAIRIPWKILDYLLKGLLFLTVLIILGAGTIYVIDIQNYRSDLQNAPTIKIGDTADSVTEILGKPAGRSFIAGKYPDGSMKKENDTWMYGKFFRWRFLNPAKDDVVIKFDSEGTVVDISIP